MDKQYLKLLLDDLLNIEEVSTNGRCYKIWKAPILDENINWFTKKGIEKQISFKSAAHKDEILTERLQDFIDKGINLKDKAYDIVRINCPLMLQKALDNGADPNVAGKDGQLPIDLSITKGTTQISKILINYPNFNFISNNQNYPNILLWSLSYSKIELAHSIILKKPDFVLDKLGELSFAYLGALLLTKDSEIAAKNKDELLNLLKLGINYAYTKNHFFDINETHRGESLINHSIDVASIIKNMEVNHLKTSLDRSNKETIKKLKL